MRSIVVMSFVVAVAAAAGCGHPPVPAKEIAQAESSLRGAEEAGAGQVPQAALHVKMSRDQLLVGQRLVADDEIELARKALARATLDAEVAVALARENQARREADTQAQRAQSMQLPAGTP
jgi:pyridoxal biosynthesis lyase PdxS